MRSPTTDSQTKALATLKDLSTHLRVSVDDGSGNYADLSNLEGYNWIHSVQYTLAAGAPTAKATVKLKREAYKLSLSPFMDGSKLNAAGTVVDIARKILIETAVLPRGKQPASNEWEKVFRGYIEKIAWERSPIVLTCQDLGSELLGRFVETQLLYAETDNLLHEVIQDLVDDTSPDVDVVSANLTWTTGSTTVTTGDTSEAVVGDWLGAGNGSVTNRSPFFEIVTVNAGVSFIITNPIGRTIPTAGGGGKTAKLADADRISLYIEGANPTWAIHEYWQTKDRVLSALRKLAQQIGYEVSYRWNTGTSDFELTLWTPDRSASSPDVTIGPGVYKDIRKLAIARSKIRNKIKITAMVPDAAGTRTTVTRQDAASQAKYGTRYMEVTEKGGAQINTVSEMQDFGDIILADLKDPGADAVVVIPYRWDLQPADYARFSADGVRFDTDQDLGTVSLSHNLPNNGEPVTSIAVRGKPSGGVNRWFELEGMPGVAPPVDLRSDEAPTGTGSTPHIASIIIEFDNPRTMSPSVDDWAYTRVYTHTSDPGSPPNPAYLVAAGKQTRFEIGGLLPGTLYHSRLEHIDIAGNVGNVTGDIQETTQMVGPYHENPDRQHGQLLMNGDFGAQTLPVAANEPDVWAMSFRNWGAAESLYISTTVHGTGNRSLHFFINPAGSDPTIQSEFFPVNAGELLTIETLWQIDDGTADNSLKVWIVEYEEDKNTLVDAIRIVDEGFFGTDVDVWIRTIFRGLIINANTRYALIRIQKDTGGVDCDLYVDRIIISRDRAAFEAGNIFAQAIGTGAWTTVEIPSIFLDRGDGVDNINDEYVVQYSGEYAFVFTYSLTGLGAGKETKCKFQLDTGGGYSDIVESPPFIPSAFDTDNGAFSTGVMALDEGDKVRVQVKHDHGSDRNITGVTARFTGQQITL